MDPYFRQRHGSGPSPIDDSSPHSANSQYRNFGTGQGVGAGTGIGGGNTGLDRILQSPQDLNNFNRFNTGMDTYNTLVSDGSRGNGNGGGGFDSFRYAQPQASGSGTSNQPLAAPSQSGVPTGKRGTKACVACESIRLYHESGATKLLTTGGRSKRQKSMRRGSNRTEWTV